MGVIKVETFDIDATNGATHTLTNNVGSLNSAFVRRTTSIDKQTGPVGSTGNANPNAVSSSAYLLSTTQIAVTSATGTQKLVGEVWRYTGAASGPDEFISRGRYSITLTGTTASQSVSGIVDVNRCVPFWLGNTNSNASVNDYDASTISVYIDSGGVIRLERGASTGNMIVEIQVVEFTGTNWKVGHGRSSSHDTSAETITLTNGSDGISGGTFDTGGWSKAMIIEGSLEGDTSETGLSDNLGCWVPGGTASEAQFVLHQDGSARNDGVAYCHVIAHEGLAVNRSSNTNWSEGNNSYASVPWPAGASTTESLDELALEWFADTSGTGTAHARGRVSGRINSTSTITAWVHRSGNNVRLDWGVVELGGVDGTAYGTITNVDGDNVLGNTQTNIVISGAGFGASQGAGTLFLTQNADGSGTSVQQLNIDSWNDTAIQFDLTAGALADSDCYVRVTPDGGQTITAGVQVGVPPETYYEAIMAMTPAPDHYWPFQNSYNDEKGSATANNFGSGTSFQTDRLLVRGDTHSLEIDTITDYCGPSDQGDMNTTSSAQRRYMGGWVQVDRIIQALSVVWEEGAQVNNYALLIGFGNTAMWQFADDGGDYVQAYHDIKWTPNRPYHVMMEFQGPNHNSGICGCFLDGIKQTKSNGNPWEVTSFPSHSGNISWGHEGVENLQTGDSRGVDNVDIAFASCVEANYAHWYSWNDTTVPSTTIRETLFVKGAPADQIIGGDTEANMQIAIDALADTVIPDWPCGIEIGNCSEGAFQLTFDNINFSDRCTMPIRYMGSSTLTVVLANGSDINESLCEAPYGGAIVFERPATLIISGVINGAEVRLYDDDIGGNNYGTELAGTESNSGTTFPYSHAGLTNDIIVQMMASGFEEVKVPFQLNSSDQTLTLNPKVELNA